MRLSPSRPKLLLVQGSEPATLLFMSSQNETFSKCRPQIYSSEPFVSATTILILTSGNCPDCFADSLTSLKIARSPLFWNPHDVDFLSWPCAHTDHVQFHCFPPPVRLIRAALKQRFTDGSVIAYLMLEADIPEGRLSCWAVNRRKDGSVSVPISMVGKALASSCSSPAAGGEEPQRLGPTELSVYPPSSCLRTLAHQSVFVAFCMRSTVMESFVLKSNITKNLFCKKCSFCKDVFLTYINKWNNLKFAPVDIILTRDTVQIRMSS